MPRGGHNRKSAEEHVLDGTYRADRHGAPAALLKLPRKARAKIRASQRSQKRFCRTAADERALRDGCRFNQALVDHVVSFIRSYCHHSKGQFAGQPFEPAAWQIDEIIAPLFGWVRADGQRRFRRTYIELPKKNGKSTLAAALGLYMLVADEESGAEIYSCGADRDQARIVHSEAINMIEASPELDAVLKINRTTGNVYYPGTLSYYRACSAAPRGKHGFNIHCAIIDELHEWQGRALWDALKYGYRARRQPLQFVITNAGDDIESVCYHQYQRAKAILAGDLYDESFFALIYEADPTDDWTKLATWRKANPGLGTIISERDVRQDIDDALQTPSEQPLLKRLGLGIWQTAAEPWIDIGDWDACQDDYDEDDLAEGMCWVGIDLAKTRDLTAVVFIFPDEIGEEFRLLAYHWLPSDTAQEYADRVDFPSWHQQGLIDLTPGNWCDYTRIRKKLRQLFRRFDVQQVCYDPSGADNLVQQLQEEDGFDAELFAEFNQGRNSYAGPTAEFERLILAKRLLHNGNPLMRWQAGHVMVNVDGLGRMRPEKPKRGDIRKIDGIVATIFGLHAALIAEEQTDSVYESRGIRTT